jgi:hypothetical protein
MEDVQYSFPDPTGQEMLIEVSGMKDITGRRIETKHTHPWKFDRVFGPNSTKKKFLKKFLIWYKVLLMDIIVVYLLMVKRGQEKPIPWRARKI